jgi:hypothetical protein
MLLLLPPWPEMELTESDECSDHSERHSRVTEGGPSTAPNTAVILDEAEDEPTVAGTVTDRLSRNSAKDVADVVVALWLLEPLLWRPE